MRQRLGTQTSSHAARGARHAPKLTVAIKEETQLVRKQLGFFTLEGAPTEADAPL
jgi:hypothetical protein